MAIELDRPASAGAPTAAREIATCWNEALGSALEGLFGCEARLEALLDRIDGADRRRRGEMA